MLHRRLLVIFGLVLSCGMSLGLQMDPELMSRDQVLQDFKDHFDTADSVDEFFKKRWERAANKDDKKFQNCLGWLKDLTNRYRTARAEGRFTAMENLMVGVDELPSLVRVLNICGPCISSTKKVKDWSYLSEGWCRYRNLEKIKFNDIYPQITDYVTTYSSFRKTKGGVFNAMMEFAPIGLDPIPKKIPSAPSTAFIAVDGSLWAYGYLARLAHLDRPMDSVANFIFQFNGQEDIPDEVQRKYRRVKDPALPNRTLKVTLINDVDGRLFVDKVGNLNYKTWAYFGIAEGALPLESTADRIMIDTVWNLYDRFLPVTAREDDYL